jgi:hypothetical protein
MGVVKVCFSVVNLVDMDGSKINIAEDNYVSVQKLSDER